MTKISQENTLIDIPDLNRFRIGDQVVVDASEGNDRSEGIVIGIELRRSVHGGPFQTDITLLHDGYVTDGFKPADCRKVKDSPNNQMVGVETLIEKVEHKLLQISRMPITPISDDLAGINNGKTLISAKSAARQALELITNVRESVNDGDRLAEPVPRVMAVISGVDRTGSSHNAEVEKRSTDPIRDFEGIPAGSPGDQQNVPSFSQSREPVTPEDSEDNHDRGRITDDVPGLSANSPDVSARGAPIHPEPDQRPGGERRADDESAARSAGDGQSLPSSGVDGEPLIPAALRAAIEDAIETLDWYADPTGYNDSNGEPLPADYDTHPGLLAIDAAAKLRGALQDSPNSQMVGYEEAFYELAKLMDIPAQDKSPREVWESQMLPKLREALSPVSQVVGATTWRYRANDKAVWQYSEGGKPVIADWIVEPLFEHPSTFTEQPIAWFRRGKYKWFVRYEPPTAKSEDGWFPVYRTPLAPTPAPRAPE